MGASEISHLPQFLDGHGIDLVYSPRDEGEEEEEEKERGGRGEGKGDGAAFALRRTLFCDPGVIRHVFMVG